MKFSFDKLKSMQIETAKQFKAEGAIELKDIKKVAGFDVTYDGGNAICAGVIIDADTFEILESKTIVVKVPMNYVPGFLAFREGPPILQVYYDFEYDPDVLIIGGHGIAHPRKCGLATYIGVELAKPTIGIAKSLLEGEVKDSDIVMEGEVVGKEVKTREHAKPLFVSQGNMLSLNTAVELIKKMIVPPHKLPEPLHIAHKLASKKLKEIREKK